MVLNFLKSLFSRNSVSLEAYKAEVTERERLAREILTLKRDQEARIAARTERLHFENMQLKATIDQAEKRRAQEASLVALLSHDIRTPLNGVVGMLELMRLDELSEEHSELIQLATRSSDKLTDIVGKIVDYSKLEAQQMKLDVGEFDLKTAMADAVAAFSEELASRNLSVELKTRGDIARTVLGDGQRFVQVLKNILERSIAVSREGCIEVELACHRVGNSLVDVEVRIHDPGDNYVDAEVQERYLSGVGIEVESGEVVTKSGLGIAISKRLVELMQGNIAMATEPGIGTTYKYTARFENVERTAASIAESVLPKRQLEKLDILLAEDDETSQIHLVRLLAEAGHVVKVVDSGVLAVAAAEQRQFDLILMDIILPVMDGIVAAKLIRSDGGASASVPIVALTANVGTRERDHYLANGMNEYVTKPINSEALFTAIGRVAQTHEQSGTA